MAQVKLLKIGTDGLQEEFNSTADEITMLSFTVNGGGPVLSGSGLDMNDTAISEASDLSFNDPTTDGITRTDGTHAADDIMMQDAENILLPTEAAILFGTATDAADQVDAFRLPAIAGAPTATPADGGSGYLLWDSIDDRLFAWTGSSWNNLTTADNFSYEFIPVDDIIEVPENMQMAVFDELIIEGELALVGSLIMEA